LGGIRVGLQAKTKLSRKEFGISYTQAPNSSAIVGDEIEIESMPRLSKRNNIATSWQFAIAHAWHR